MRACDFIDFLHDLRCTFARRGVHLHVCLCMCAAVIAALFICLTSTSLCSHALHLSSGALYSCSNCHRSDCSSLDAMEAVIGHPRHSDQCHRYYQDFRHPGPQTARPSRGQRGTGREGERWASTACYVCTEDWTTACLGVYWQLAVQHTSALSPSSSLTLSLHRICLSSSTHPSPCLIKGTPLVPCLVLPPERCQRVILCSMYSWNLSITAITMSVFCFILAHLMFKTSLLYSC